MIVISSSVQLLAIAASLFYLAAVLLALRNSRMNVRQSVLWILSGFSLLGVTLFPFPVMRLAERVGFVVPANGAFVVWLLILTVLIFYQSLTTSRQAAQIKTLCQELAILTGELRLRHADSAGSLLGGRSLDAAADPSSAGHGPSRSR